MESTSNKMDTSGAQNKLQTFLNTDLPDDDEIKERLEEDGLIQGEETDSDSDISSDSDVEGSMEKELWDALFPNLSKPYENTKEDLTILLHKLTTRSSTRQPKISLKLAESDPKSLDSVKKVQAKPLKGEEIDEDILIENMERMSVIIRKKIKKKTKAEAGVRDCEVKLERMIL